MASVVLGKCRIKYGDIATVLTEYKPFIYWDTCSMLYFISIIGRRKYDEYEWDLKLLDMIEKGQVYSVTSDLVLQEFNKHHDDLLNEDIVNEQKLSSLMTTYAGIIGSPQKEDIEKGAAALVLSVKLEDMVQRLWANTYIIDDDPIFRAKAHNRVLGCISPSSKKKQEYKDCYIWESYLATCDHSPYPDMGCFMSENIKDYCGDGNTPLPDIANDIQKHHCNAAFDKTRLWVMLAKKIGMIS